MSLVRCSAVGPHMSASLRISAAPWWLHRVRHRKRPPMSTHLPLAFGLFVASHGCPRLPNPPLFSSKPNHSQKGPVIAFDLTCRSACSSCAVAPRSLPWPPMVSRPTCLRRPHKKHTVGNLLKYTLSRVACFSRRYHISRGVGGPEQLPSKSRKYQMERGRQP